MGSSRMGNKSKFTFPVPGRSNRPQQIPSLSISNPLTKAQKILGTGTLGIDGSPTLSKEPGRSWETGSSSGISISISESTASHSTMDTGLGVMDEDEATGAAHGRRVWDQESEIIPRQMSSTHSHRARLKGLTGKKSSVTVGADYQDAVTDNSYVKRRESNSSIWSHYDPAKLPLSISQQTSSSAMAKGLPSKGNSHLEVDGAHLTTSHKKKKPTRLDFSILRSRSRNRKDQNVAPPEPKPFLGNSYATRSSSFISQSRTSSTVDVSATASSRSGANKDTGGLQQLYSHYEKMSFGDSSALDEEEEEEEEEEDMHPQYLEPRTYTPSTLTPDLMPLSYPTVRDHGAQWKHSRSDTQDSRVTAIRSDTPSTLQMYRKDYPASVSSRHTRTSKATPSTRSIVESDRQQNSVLSLTDSDSDDELISSSSIRSPPYHENTSREDLSISSDHRQFGAAQRPATQPRGTSSTRSSTYGQLNDFLTIPRSSSRSQSSRSAPNYTSHSNHSSSSVPNQTQPGSTQMQDVRPSTRPTETARSHSSAANHRQTGYGIQEARAIALKPAASTAEAAPSVPVPGTPTSIDFGHSARYPSNRISNNSHVSDQPTPPLSPNSVEFYMRSPESVRKEAIASDSNSVNNARLMAVTRQEEMLLAALRMKRAKMRENIIAEMGEDRSRPASVSSGTSSIRDRKTSAERHSSMGFREGMGSRASSRSQILPAQISTREHSAERSGHRHGRQPSHSKGTRSADAWASTNRSSPASKARSLVSAPTAGPTSSPMSQPASKSRHERVLLYLDQPVDHLNAIDTTEPCPDLAELMDSDQEYLLGERRSKTRSSHSSIHGYYNNSSRRTSNGQSRLDSSPMSGGRSSSPLRPLNSLEDVPEVPHGQTEEDVYDESDLDEDDDIDLDDFPTVVRQTLPPQDKEKELARPDSAAADGLLHPASAGHIRNKKSDVRLSAVGVASPIPWWGDDD